MKWIRKGKIFDPGNHGLSMDCSEYAQSPQTLEFDDFVRVYFSTRKREENQQFLSHIQYVDFKKDFSEIVGYSQKPVFEKAALGSFDEHGIFPVNVLRHGDKIMAYTCGWSRRISVPVETATGLAFSEDDGCTFKRFGTGPVLGPSLHEPCLVGDSFVRYFENRFHMWYIYGAGWFMDTSNAQEPPARVYKIAHAWSEDGIQWQKDEAIQIIADKLGATECQALPTVAYSGGRYHMFFCYRYATDFRSNPSRGYRLGYAWSEDLIQWTRDDEAGGMPLSEEGWDSEMMCYPHIFSMDGKLHLLYNGNMFGKSGFGLAVLSE